MEAWRLERDYARGDESDVPDELRARIDARAGELEALGFAPLGWMREVDPVDGSLPPVFTKLLRRDDPVAYALAGETEIVFLSAAEDGRKLATAASSERHDWAGLKKHVWIAANAGSDTEQWQRHLGELEAQADFEARDVSADELIAEWADSARRANEHMLESGAYVRLPDGRVRLGLRAALRRSLAQHRPLRVELGRRQVAAALAGLLAAFLVGGFRVWSGIEAQPAAAPVVARAAAPLPPTAAELQRELDRRERAFGMESLEVAALLETFPPEPAGERAAALVRQLRLVAIYVRAPERAAELARARDALARLRTQPPDPL